MNDKSRTGKRRIFFLVLSLVLTAIIYLSSIFFYRTGLASVRQGVIRVELAGFIENTRYALHFGKDINTFYRMNELLADELNEASDVDGLYVISSDGSELFATDGRELSSAVLSMKGGSRTEGNQFYTAAALDETGNATLISRTVGTEVLLVQSNFMFSFLIFCVFGFVISSVVILLVTRNKQKPETGKVSCAVIVIIWIAFASFVMNYETYSVYSGSLVEMEQLITDSVDADLRKVSDMGISDSSIAPLNSYFDRYIEAADEVSAMSVADDGEVLITMKPFIGRFVSRFTGLTVTLILIILIASRIFESRLELRWSSEAEEEILINESLERNSIKRRLRVLVLAISATALAVTSIIAVVIMMSIRSQSETALINETKSNLTVIALDTASIVEEMMVKYSDYADFFASVTGKVNQAQAETDSADNISADMNAVSFEGSDGTEYILTTIAGSDSAKKESFINERSRILETANLLVPYLEDEDNYIFSIYWGSKSGFLSMLTSEEHQPDSDAVYNFHESEWYKKAEKERGVVFTGVYLDAFGEGKVITCAAPYYDENGNFAGVLGIDITISDICARLDEMNLGENSYAFIVDSLGYVISIRGDYVPLEEAEQLDEDARNRLLTSDGSVFERNGIYYTGSKVEVCDWTVCIHAPAGQELQMVQAIDYQIRTAIVVFVVVFAIIMILVFLIIRRAAAGIADPIIELETDVRKISGGNLEHRARVNTDDEVGRLAQSFNDMSSSLKEYIENIRDMTAKQERIGAELSVATRIQADMLPSDFGIYADRKEFDIYASMTPAKEVGGDFYDFFLIDDNHLGLVMADVSGKGVPAALFMVVTRTLIRNCALTGASPEEILRKVNDELCENNKELLFVTVWIGILDLTTGALATSDAGHEYPAIKRKNDNSYELLVMDHYAPLGTMQGNEYVRCDVTLSPGDAIFLYTDGASDAKDNSGEKLGMDRLMTYINSHADKTAKEQIEMLRSDLDSYMGGAEPFDDITVMCVRYHGKEKTDG